MDKFDKQILDVLGHDGGGFTTGGIAERVYPMIGHNSRTHSGGIRSRLLQLEKLGLVGRLDDQKPVCWVRKK